MGRVGNCGIKLLCRIRPLPLRPILTSLSLASAQRVPSQMIICSPTFRRTSWMPWGLSQEFWNSGTELAIEEVKNAVKAALTFLGNASSRCTSIRRQGVLQDYNKDLMSFAAESDELFCSATKTLLGPAFPENVSPSPPNANPKELQDFQCCCEIKPIGFSEGPLAILLARG